MLNIYILPTFVSGFHCLQSFVCTGKNSAIFKYFLAYMGCLHILLLLNESLATTNAAEGLYIVKDVVKAMRYLSVRSVFNTHMHKLARSLDDLDSTESEIRVESMVTGVENGNRSFKIFIAPPQGISYAKDIAEKYGVTVESIKNDIDSRKS